MFPLDEKRTRFAQSELTKALQTPTLPRSAGEYSPPVRPDIPVPGPAHTALCATCDDAHRAAAMLGSPIGAGDRMEKGTAGVRWDGQISIDYDVLGTREAISQTLREHPSIIGRDDL